MSETLAVLASRELLARVRKLAQAGNALEADLLAHLGEVDARRLYRSGDEIRRLLADREPKPPASTLVRRIPELAKTVAAVELPQAASAPLARPTSPPPPTPVRARTEPLGAERYRVQFTADHTPSSKS